MSTRKKSKKKTIFTIGHSTRPLEELIELLRAHEVRRVIDIRTMPRSRRNPQYNRETLGPATVPQNWIRAFEGSWGTAAREIRLEEHRLAQCKFSRLCGLHADIRIRYWAKACDQAFRREAERLDVRRSSSLALSPVACSGRAGSAEISGGTHHERYACKQAQTNFVCAAARRESYISLGQARPAQAASP